jgi:hypothetical protein
MSDRAPPRPPPRKLSSFDIRSIPKKPPAPSLNYRRSRRPLPLVKPNKGKR